jgi:ABC-2 type transport system ATP-binding protein
MTSVATHVDAPTVVADGVSKWYGQKVAVSDVSCSFGAGVTGLLGPNGAGKTTFLRLLTGMVVPSRGTVSLLGSNPRANPSVYEHTALVPEDEAVYQHMTAWQFVRWSAALTKVADPDRAAAAAIAQVELADAATRRLETFSKGMRQRAKVAAALVHDPQILFLDEPLNGADPLQRAKLIELFVRLGSEGRTVVVSSHVLAEVERMAGRVIAMVDGRLAAAGSVTSLRNALSDIPRRIRIDVDDPRRLAVALIAQPWAASLTVDGSTLHVDTTDPSALGTLIPAVAKAEQLRLTRVEPEDESLESVFRYLVDGR